MPRVLAGLAALTVALFTVAAPSGVRAAEETAPTVAAATAPNPTPPLNPGYLDGVDVSYHQGTIDWPQVAAAGKRFAFVRATAGTLTADSAYAANSAGARAAGLVVGSYHFANPDWAPNDATNEARWFVSNASVQSGDLVPVLDLETSNDLDAGSLTTWAQTWLTEVTATTGIRPIIYTNPGFWARSMTDTDWFARNGYSVVWVANWTPRDQPSVPAGSWGAYGWTFWQHSSTGSVPGIAGAVDLDRFNGSALPSWLLVP
jgi:lysozyme